jgi:hypothetical protein
VRARASLLAAAVIALGAGAAGAATLDELGTLFTTPQERARLERLRRGEPETQPSVAGVARAQPTVTGFVRRSDGRSTVWIDGAPIALRRRAGPDPLLDPANVGAPAADATLRIERKTPRQAP